MSRQVHVGLDLGSTVCEAAARERDGKIIGALKFPPSERELRRAAAHFKGEVRVLLEEGELAHWAAGCVRGLVQEVVVCAPKRNAWIYKDSRKDDRGDAGKLAEILRLGQYRAVYQSEDEDQDLSQRATNWASAGAAGALPPAGRRGGGCRAAADAGEDLPPPPEMTARAHPSQTRLRVVPAPENAGGTGRRSGFPWKPDHLPVPVGSPAVTSRTSASGARPPG